MVEAGVQIDTHLYSTGHNTQKDNWQHRRCSLAYSSSGMANNLDTCLRCPRRRPALGGSGFERTEEGTTGVCGVEYRTYGSSSMESYPSSRSTLSTVFEAISDSKKSNEESRYWSYGFDIFATRTADSFIQLATRCALSFIFIKAILSWRWTSVSAYPTCLLFSSRHRGVMMRVSMQGMLVATLGEWLGHD